MHPEVKQLIENLNHDDKGIKLESLRLLMQKIEAGEMNRPTKGFDVNNHIHTTYSFSPYSPTKAIWMSYSAGLSTAGIMDHDSIGGAEEFIEAGKITGMATTIGVECRADFSKTVLNGKRINKPDQASIAYIALHGIPHTQIAEVKQFFKPYTSYRNIRNEQMVTKINEMLGSLGVRLNFEKDVIPISNFNDGGSITERHVLYALSLKLIELFGKGAGLLSFLKGNLRLNVSEKIENYLMDLSNPYYGYDLLGLLKSELVSGFYIKATLECADIKDILKFSKSIGAISAYPYLGDVGDSVTGDKKAQKFEDAYLEHLFRFLSELGIHAVTYMPSRNTMAQIDKIRSLCDRYGFFQISGEDINSPRQSFICEALRNDKFSNLYDASWALVGHESAATENLSTGMFSDDTVEKYPDLTERVLIYKEIGFKIK